MAHLETPHGRIAFIDTGPRGADVLLIHGNSACKEIFQHQLDAPLARRHRLVAFDLPGHGASDDAPDANRSYSFVGYADAALAIVDALRLSRPVIVGWSLGGHIAIELLTRGTSIAGILLTGTPPAGVADFAEAFLPHPHMSLTGQRDFSEDEVLAYARETTGTHAPFIEAAVRRTDGRARALMVQSAMAPDAANQRRIIEATRVPTAVVTGEREPFVNNDYLDRVAWGNLWEQRVQRIAGAGHAPFFERPEAFNDVLSRFVDAVR